MLTRAVLYFNYCHFYYNNTAILNATPSRISCLIIVQCTKIIINYDLLFPLNRNMYTELLPRLYTFVPFSNQDLPILDVNNN